MVGSNVVELKKSFETEDTVYVVSFLVDNKKKRILRARAFIRYYPLAREGFGNYSQSVYVIDMTTMGRWAKLVHEVVREGWNGTGSEEEKCPADKPVVREFLNRAFKAFMQAPDKSPTVMNVARGISKFVMSVLEEYYAED